MAHYRIDTANVTVSDNAATLFKVGFGDPGQNDAIVRDAESRMVELENGNLGGGLALINGPASLPAAVVISHHLIHRFEAVAVFDPKMSGYVVSAAHGGRYRVGDLIPATDVQEVHSEPNHG